MQNSKCKEAKVQRCKGSGLCPGRLPQHKVWKWDVVQRWKNHKLGKSRNFYVWEGDLVGSTISSCNRNLLLEK